MDIKLDFRSRVPIQLQIEGQIRQWLVSGKAGPGERLPTVRELATVLGVNFTTVARVYRRLDGEGLLSTQQGRGTYALEGGQLKTVDSGKDRLSDLTNEFILNAERMGFDKEEIWVAVEAALGKRR
jgi:GntR family transcriptional regulator